MSNSLVRLQEDSLMKSTSAIVGFGPGFEAGRLRRIRLALFLSEEIVPSHHASPSCRMIG